MAKGMRPPLTAEMPSAARAHGYPLPVTEFEKETQKRISSECHEASL